METVELTDRGLLERAAKAAGIEIDKSETNGGGRGNTGFDVMGNAILDWHNCTRWNPLTDDADAFRLAVKLGLFFHPEFSRLHSMELAESEDRDELRVYRRAIVRAAAAMAGEG